MHCSQQRWRHCVEGGLLQSHRKDVALLVGGIGHNKSNVLSAAAVSVCVWERSGHWLAACEVVNQLFSHSITHFVCIQCCSSLQLVCQYLQKIYHEKWKADGTACGFSLTALTFLSLLYNLESIKWSLQTLNQHNMRLLPFRWHNHWMSCWWDTVVNATCSLSLIKFLDAIWTPICAAFLW